MLVTASMQSAAWRRDGRLLSCFLFWHWQGEELRIVPLATGRGRSAAALRAKRNLQRRPGGEGAWSELLIHPPAWLRRHAVNDSDLIVKCLAGAERCPQLLNQGLIGRAGHL